MTSGSRRKTRAEKAAETRQRLLDAGVEMILEDPIAPPINTVSANEVAYRAGLTAGALYHHWEDQEAYRDELTGYLLGPDRVHESMADMIPVIASVRRKGIVEMTRVGTAENFRRTVEDPYWRLNIAFIASQRPGALEQLRDKYEISRKAWAPYYEEVLSKLGLRARAPFDLSSLSVMLAAIIEGLALRHLSGIGADSSLADTSDPDAWPLVALATLAFLASALESDDFEPGVTLIDLARPNIDIASAPAET